MAEDLHITATSKAEKYKELLPQLEALIGDEQDLIANMANTCGALHTAFGFFWVGFYLVKGQQLVLGPFQGPVACTRIDLGRGVCGTSWQKKEILIVPDVDQFPGHIACSALSKSEIVIPLFDKVGGVAGVLDVDSDQLNDFNETDRLYLTQITRLLRF